MRKALRPPGPGRGRAEPVSTDLPSVHRDAAWSEARGRSRLLPGKLSHAEKMAEVRIE